MRKVRRALDQVVHPQVLVITPPDKAGRTYFEHVLRVADSLDTTENEKLVAVMHDLLEDTILDSVDLSCAGCPPHVRLA